MYTPLVYKLGRIMMNSGVHFMTLHTQHLK